MSKRGGLVGMLSFDTIEVDQEQRDGYEVRRGKEQ